MARFPIINFSAAKLRCCKVVLFADKEKVVVHLFCLVTKVCKVVAVVLAALIIKPSDKDRTEICQGSETIIIISWRNKVCWKLSKKPKEFFHWLLEVCFCNISCIAVVYDTQYPIRTLLVNGHIILG